MLLMYEGPNKPFNLSLVQNCCEFCSKKPPTEIPYPLLIALVLFGCGMVFSLIAFTKGGPSSILAAIAKSGFTAAFMLIFVSEIGDKVTKKQDKSSNCVHS